MLRTLQLVAAGLWLAGCGGGVLDPQGPVGGGNRQIFISSLAVMLVIVVPTIIGHAGERGHGTPRRNRHSEGRDAAAPPLSPVPPARPHVPLRGSSCSASVAQ